MIHHKQNRMKKLFVCFASLAVIMTACNNEAKDSVAKADSTNDVKEDKSPAAIKTDESTTDFLVRAADGGMAEVKCGQIAQEKGMDRKVTRFAAMMVKDHTNANAEVKALAASRNVTLPATPSDENQKNSASLNEKKGKDFDKAYMDMMVADHKKAIDLFEAAEKDTKDAEVKTFITNTIPKLKMHLDSAQAIRKAIK